jgi:hypothetical protein
MPSNPRSIKQQMDAYVAERRGSGASWAQIAADFQARYKLTPLRAFREAHRYTQGRVVGLWNERWPDAPLNEHRLGAWEAWPAKGSNAPSLPGLENLARLYQCRAGDLIPGDDHGHADRQSAHHPPDLRADAQSSVAPGQFGSFLADLSAGPISPGAPTPSAMGRLREAEFGSLVTALIEWADRMKRRDLLALITSAAAAAHAAPLLTHLDDDDLERLALVAQTPSRIDEQTLGHIEAILRHAIRQEDVLGPHAVLETALAQHRLVQRLLASGPDRDLQRKLTRLLADIRRFIGWLAFNSGDIAGAEHFYSQARRAAHDADDDLMTSYILAQWSHLATWNGEPRQGVEYSLGAFTWAKRAGSAALMSYANDVGARAYAGLLHRQNSRTRSKDHGRCRTALAASRANLADSTAEDPGRDLVAFFTPNMLDLTRALCHLDMREPDQAITWAREAISPMGAAYPRNQAFSHLYLSRAHAQRREIDQAGLELAKAAQLTSHNRSERLVTATATAREALSPWGRTDIVVQLDEQLRHYSLPVGMSSRT